MLTFFTSAVMNTASCHNFHICSLADVKIIINQIIQSRFGADYGYMHVLALCKRLNDYVNTGLVLLGYNFNIFRTVSAHGGTVFSYVIRTYGDVLYSCNGVKDVRIKLKHFIHSPF